MEWHIHGLSSASGKTVYYVNEQYNTKRQAVNAMMSKRKSKTPIYRDGHTYIFQVAD